MKKLILNLILLISCIAAKAQTADSLIIHYYENFPYAFTEGGKLRGIEIEIMEAYVNWSNSRGSALVVSYKPYKEFGEFYNSVKEGGPRVVGLGSVTFSKEREKEVAMSAPYLKNVAVLITPGKVATIKTKNAEEINKTLGNLKAVTVDKSSHSLYLNAIKKAYMPNLRIESMQSQNKVLEKIAVEPGYFGYADVIAYWAYLKKNPTRFLKIQKIFNESQEYLSFITPQKSAYISSVNEFFESGFGFTSTKTYRQILEHYLGYEILETVEIK